MWKFLENLFADKVFDFALGISLLLHVLILVKLPQIRPREKTIPQFIYRVQEEKKLPTPPSYAPQKGKEESGSKSAKRAYKRFYKNLAKSGPNIGKQGINTEIEQKMKKVNLLSAEQIDDELFKKMIEVQKVPADPRVKAFYLHYYDTIRAKIRDMAYKNYKPGLPEGDVFISFTLDHTGKLLSAKVVREKSSASYEICQIAICSLREAAPFRPFPKELVHDRLKFNVIISFKRR